MKAGVSVVWKSNQQFNCTYRTASETALILKWELLWKLDNSPPGNGLCALPRDEKTMKAKAKVESTF